MANIKMTRVQALEIALAATDNAEAREVLARMIEQLSKHKSPSATPTAARLGNETIARELYDMLNAGDVIDGTFVMQHTEAMTPQKVVGIMRVAIELGLFEKYKDGKRTVYRKIG